MHEMYLLQSVAGIVEEEMAQHGLTRLHRVVLKNGALAGLVSEALGFAWEVLTRSGPLEGAELVVETVPVLLACGGCGLEFTPQEQAVFAACPACGQETGHRVLDGRDVYVDSIEGEDCGGE